MERMDREKRKEILKQRQEQEAEKRNDSNFGGLNIFDFSEYEEVPFYKLKEGENRINVIPYIIQSKNHPSPRDTGHYAYWL